MKKISFLLIAVFLVLSTSGSYGYFKYIYEDVDSSSDEPTIQEEIIEEETNEPANNQTSNNTEEQSEEEEELPFEIVGIYKCIDYDSEQRCWQTHEPDSLDSAQPVPLILDLHGYGSNSIEQRLLSNFDEIADDDGAIVLYPDALDDSWNAGWCCGPSHEKNRDDFGFILHMVDIAVEYHNIDTDRIYATGWSNGCAMSQRLANEASDIFAAIGCMSWYLLQTPDSSYSPIPVIEVHGMLDPIIWYATDFTSGVGNGQFASLDTTTGAIQNLYQWKQMNGCTGVSPDYNEPNVLYSVQGFTNCENGTEVRLVSIYGAGHNPYSDDYNTLDDFPQYSPGTQGLVDSTQIVWDFMSQYSK